MITQSTSSINLLIDKNKTDQFQSRSNYELRKLEYKQQIKKQTSQKKIHSFLYNGYLFLVIVPPMGRAVYSCYYKLTGFNHSLTALDVNSMPAWLIWSIIAINEFIFYVYGVHNGAIDKTPKTASGLSKSLKNLLLEISPMRLYKDIRHNHSSGDRLKAIARLIVLANLGFFVWVTGDVSSEKVYDLFHRKFKGLAISIGILCAIGAFMTTMTFTINKVTNSFPHLLKVDKQYKTRSQKIRGVALVVLAILSAPLSVVMSKESKMPLALIIFSAILTTLVVYAVSVDGLCKKEIELLNKEIALNKLKASIPTLANDKLDRYRLNKLVQSIKEKYKHYELCQTILRKNSTSDLKDELNRIEILQNDIVFLNGQLELSDDNQVESILEQLLNINENNDKYIEQMKKDFKTKRKSLMHTYIFSKKLPITFLFLISCSVAGAGTAFSCQKFLDGKIDMPRYATWVIFIIAFLVALVGRMCFSSQEKTIKTIEKIPSSVSNKFSSVFNKNSSLEEVELTSKIRHNVY